MTYEQLSGTNYGWKLSSPPNDTVSALEFSPPSLPHNFLIAGSWDCQVRCWEVEAVDKTVLRAEQAMDGPVLDVAWHHDGSKVFIASTDKGVQCWDLVSNQTAQVAAHEAPVKTCHWIKAPNYTCLMTASWDKTLKFWDTRSNEPMWTINLPERCEGVDADYPLAAVGMAGGLVGLYSLEGVPSERGQFQFHEARLRHQSCIAIFRDKRRKQPIGFARGSVESGLAIHYLDFTKSFAFSCHCQRADDGSQEYYAVNDVACHPVHGTLATVGSDGSFSFWDKDTRTKLKGSTFDQALTKCAFNHDGQLFAYAVGSNWSKGPDYFSPDKKPAIYLRMCFEEMKPDHAL